MRVVLAAFLFEALLLLTEPGRIIALVGNAAAAIELENPARDIVEEVAVVGDDEDRARIIAQMAFEPGHRLGIEMVGRLVEEEELRLFEQKPAQRHPAPLAAGEFFHHGIVGRAAQRVHRQVDLGIEIPQPLGVDLVLELRHLVGGLVGIIGGNLVVTVDHRLLRCAAFHDVLAHRFFRIELRLLRQIADADAGRGPGFAGIIGVDARHDAQQRRFAGAVDAEHADLGVGIKGQVDVVQDLAVSGIDLGQTFHVIGELTGHASVRALSPALLVGAAIAYAQHIGATATALMSGNRTLM